jgi:hypothetical protein
MVKTEEATSKSIRNVCHKEEKKEEDEGTLTVCQV